LESLIYARFAATEPNPAKRFIAGLHGRRLRMEETAMLGEVDAVAAISEEDARAMRTAAPEANIHVIPAGVDTDYFQPSETKPDENVILSIGSLGWDPNFDATRHFLLNIFPQILEKKPNTVFWIVGAEGERIRSEAS